MDVGVVDLKLVGHIMYLLSKFVGGYRFEVDFYGVK